jgi:hypothetical protein
MGAMTLAQKLYERWSPGLATIRTPWDRMPPHAQAHWERLADEATLHLAGSDAVVSAARVTELLDLLERLLKLHKGNEFAWPAEQRVLREARAVLAELGR